MDGVGRQDGGGTGGAVRLVVGGTVGWDWVETPRGRGDGVMGGSMCYAALAAARWLGGAVGGWGRAGDDFGAGLEALRAGGVDASGVETVPGGRTFRWGAKYEGAGLEVRRTMVAEWGVESAGMAPPPFPEAWWSAECVYAGSMDPRRQGELFGAAGRGALRVADTMRNWIRERRGEVLGVMCSSDVMLANEEEAAALTGEADAARAARALLSAGAKVAVVKLGARGALMAWCGGEVRCGAWAGTEAVDGTGAGDCFGGALAAAACAEASVRAALEGAARGEEVGAAGRAALRRALARASATASVACEAFGAEAVGRAERAELERRARDIEEAAE